MFCPRLQIKTVGYTDSFAHTDISSVFERVDKTQQSFVSLSFVWQQGLFRHLLIF